MRVLAHYPSVRTAVPEGVWWDSPGGYQHHYAAGSALRKLGKLTFSTLRPDADFEDVCDALEEDDVYGDIWVSLTVPEGTAPAQMLRLARLGSATAA